MLNRRNIVLSLLAAPVVILTPGLLMPIKSVKNPRYVKSYVDIEVPVEWYAPAGFMRGNIPAGYITNKVKKIRHNITIDTHTGFFTYDDVRWINA